MSIAQEIRDVIREFYFDGTRHGKLLAEIADRVEALEGGQRALLMGFLVRLEQTAALSVPAADLTAAIDAQLACNPHLEPDGSTSWDE